MSLSNLERVSTIHPNARPKVIDGALEAARVVTSSMGVGKRNVAISPENSMPYPSPDGATIATNIKLQDRVMRIGSDWALQAARRTAKKAGDGTTTTMQIIAGILENFNRNGNVREITNELLEASKKAASMVESMSRDVVDIDELVRVATISANNDPVLGKLIADLVWEVGKHGTIYVEDSDEPKTTTEIKTGYVLEPGLASEKFMSFTPRGFSWANPKIMLVDDHVFDQKQLASTYERFYQEHHQNGQFDGNLIIVFTKIDGNALDAVVGTFLKGAQLGRVPVVALSLSGPNKMDILEDLAAISGAPIFSETTSLPLSSLKKRGNFSRAYSSPFGTIEKATFSSEEVTLFFDSEAEVVVDEKNNTKLTPSQYVDIIKATEFTGEREKLRKERISKLTKGVGYIRIGGNSESGMVSEALLIDDAQNASINALRYGYLPGGGYILMKIAEELSGPGATNGSKVLAKALRGCFKKMLQNSYYRLGIFGSTKRYEKDGYVFNMKTGQFELENKTNVLDASKAVEYAIVNATAVSCEIIKTDEVIVWETK